MSVNVSVFLPDLWSTLQGVFRLQPSAFVEAGAASGAAVVSGLSIVLVAGASEAVAQSVVLFANRVKPARFFFSWAIDAFLFVFGYGFLVASTYLVTRLPGTSHLSPRVLAIVVAISYAPLLFSFLGALPYLGLPLLTVLRVWHLLAMVVGIASVGRVGFLVAGAYVGLGWCVMVLGQNSFGKPIVQLGTRILDAVAGVELVTDEQLLVGRMQPGQAEPGVASSPAARAPGGQVRRNLWKAAAGLAAVAAMALLVAFVLDPVRGSLFSFEHHLPPVLQVPLDLVWLGVVAVIVSGFMAPLETLGWWAGWYGDAIDASGDRASSAQRPAPQAASRYLVYLDGIAQSSSRYTPDIETFLDALAPELPADVCLIRGVMSYSVMNRPLEDDPLFSRFWGFIDWMRFSRADALLGMIVNLRNVLIVAVSADSRYGPMYNYGIALVMYRSLIENGYRAGSGVPVTLIGYSGGGQMACAAARFLKRALDAPIDVISLGGVIDGNDPILALEHLHHFVGDKDKIERIGPVMFPSRWRIAVLSNWNRARRLGRLTQTSLGPVGHQVPGGMLDPEAKLPDGRTNLRQTLDAIEGVLRGTFDAIDPSLTRKPSRYAQRIQQPWNRPEHYPLDAPVPGRRDHTVPAAPWVGRLVLPRRDARFGGAWLDVIHAPPDFASLAGRRVKLCWDRSNDAVQAMLLAVTRDVWFSPQADYTSTYGGLVHPVRIDRWRLVDPLESLAGAHSIDDVLVKLDGPVAVDTAGADPVLAIERHPVELGGPSYALIRFVDRADDGSAVVQHYNASTGGFTGPRETVAMPAAAARNDFSSSPAGDAGWYAYGARDASGTFVISALEPRRLLNPRLATPLDPLLPWQRYARWGAWNAIAENPGDAWAAADARAWNAGDEALAVHVEGGDRVGTFAYGIARLVEEPLAQEPRLQVTYHRIVSSNTDGVISAAADWSRANGDLQTGAGPSRPACDFLIRHERFTAPEVLDRIRMQLEAMSARYRIGDGTGGTYAGLASNCTQDSNRALFAALGDLRRLRAARKLRGALAPFGIAKRAWSGNEYDLGSTIEDEPIRNVLAAVGSWRCALPRYAAQIVAETLLRDGASVWALQSHRFGSAESAPKDAFPWTLP